MNFAQALRAAKALGYTGDETPEAVQVWLAHADRANDSVVLGTKTYKANDIKIEAAKGGKTAVIEDEAPNKGGVEDQPADFDRKVEATVNDRLKRLGLVDDTGKALQRPGGISPETKIGSVKSGDERMYECRIKSGDAFFSDYETAKAAHLWLKRVVITGHVMQGQASGEQLEQAQKAFLQFTSGKALYSTGSATAGGALVPDAFQPELIRNVLDYGVARKLARVIPMNSPSIKWPRRTGGTTGGYVGENATSTPVAASYDNITLTAHTYRTVASVSNEMLQDSGLPFVDITMEELAYDIARAEDDALLIGNASPTYGGITGFEFKYGLVAADTGYNVTGGADTVSHTAADIDKAIGRVPQYARANMAITCTPAIRANLFDRLSTSTPGGLTLSELTGHGMVMRWKGVPIIENNSMSSVLVASTTNRPGGFTAGDQIDFLVGDFRKAALFGERLNLELAVDTSVGFTEYATWLRAVVRHDVNVHNSGPTGAATSTTAGPVVAFWQT